jgi:hypothetical protein
MESVDKRQIGPVTTAASGGVAAAGVLSWLIETAFPVEVPTDVQTYLGILFVILAGWAVRPAGKRSAL